MVLDVADAFEAFTSEANLLNAVIVEEVAPEGFNFEQRSGSDALLELLLPDQFLLQPLLRLFLRLPAGLVVKLDWFDDVERESREVGSAEVGALVGETPMLWRDQSRGVGLDGQERQRRPRPVDHVLEEAATKFELRFSEFGLEVDPWHVSNRHAEVAEVVQDRTSED